MPQPNYLEYALAYAQRGWAVLPLGPGQKTPLTKHGLKDATTNEIIITRWWDQWPNANIGIATGEDAGVWVLDIDGEDGSRSLVALENEIGALPETLEQKTGGGGRQLFFAWPSREIRNKQNLRQGIDVRGNGGYVVAPPSLHPSGQRYDWPYGSDTTIANAPAKWLELVAPSKRNVPPWERLSPSKAAPPSIPTSVVGAPIIDRARKYLATCDPAIQGQGGHDALLWAARALVVGFELDDDTAISLLWDEFNPLCSPPWDRGKQSDVRDFQRKVGEARRTPGQKRRGWLLDELGLRDSRDALAQLGKQSAENLLSAQVRPFDPEEKAEESDRKPFPLDLFPKPIEDYCRQVAESHGVDESFVGLPALAVAAAAMGNAWRLSLKKGFNVCPTLWVGIVSPSGTNKSGPLNEVMAPLRAPVPIEDTENALLNPQGRMVVSDATTEAVIARMSENPRGLLVFRDELAGWAKGFNAYKSGGGDEQAWLEFWGAKEYVLDRKTNNEQIRIPAASCCVLGGIQPKILVECFDPGKFASGLVPRILIACPPERDMYWSEAEVGEYEEADWHKAILFLRTRPFAGFDPNTGTYAPHVLRLAADAKVAYVKFFNEVSHRMSGMEDEHCRGVASKARVIAGRLALVHHGLRMAMDESVKPTDPVNLASVEAGCGWARWCLEELMRVFGFAGAEYEKAQTEYLLGVIREKSKSAAKGATVRQVMRWNNRKYKQKEAALAAMEQLVVAGYAKWGDERKEKVVLV